jgi:hypothetical protein
VESGEAAVSAGQGRARTKEAAVDGVSLPAAINSLRVLAARRSPAALYGGEGEKHGR